MTAHRPGALEWGPASPVDDRRGQALTAQLRELLAERDAAAKAEAENLLGFALAVSRGDEAVARRGEAAARLAEMRLEGKLAETEAEVQRLRNQLAEASRRLEQAEAAAWEEQRAVVRLRGQLAHDETTSAGKAGGGGADGAYRGRH